MKWVLVVGDKAFFQDIEAAFVAAKLREEDVEIAFHDRCEGVEKLLLSDDPPCAAIVECGGGVPWTQMIADLHAFPGVVALGVRGGGYHESFADAWAFMENRSGTCLRGVDDREDGYRDLIDMVASALSA